MPVRRRSCWLPRLSHRAIRCSFVVRHSSWEPTTRPRTRRSRAAWSRFDRMWSFVIRWCELRCTRARRGRSGARSTRRSLGSSIELILIVGSATSPRPHGSRTKNSRCQLEEAAERAASRGGYAAAGLVHARGGECLTGTGEQARRLLRAADRGAERRSAAPGRCVAGAGPSRSGGSAARDGSDAARRPCSCAARGSGLGAGSSARRRPRPRSNRPELGARRRISKRSTRASCRSTSPRASVRRT